MANFSDLDIEVVARIARGDQQAFRQLVNLYNSTVYGFIATHVRASELVEEVVNDVFIHLWQTKETLPELRNLGTYIFVIARNKALNALKAELREKERRTKWNVEDANTGDPEEIKKEELTLSLIDAAIDNLPMQQRKVWVMSRKESLTYVQIADQLGISKETVKTYLKLANESIKKFVIGKLNDPTLQIVFFTLLIKHYPLS